MCAAPTSVTRPGRALRKAGPVPGRTRSAAPAVAPLPAGHRSVVLCLLALAVLGLLTVNPLLTAGAFLVAALLVVLLWRPGAPPVLLFVTGMLWLQAGMKVLHADALGMPVADMALRPATIEAAIVLTLLSTLAIGLGMRLGMGRHVESMVRLEADANRLSIMRLGAVTVLVWVLVTLAETYAPPATRQLVIAISALKWALLFALACTVLLQQRGYLVLGAIVLAQLVIGFTGFFSEFKFVLFLLFMAALTARPHITPGRLPRLLAGVAVIVGLGLVWTAIKADLREFLNAGTGEQVVLRTPTERLQGLANELSTLEGGELAEASEALAERLAYVDYFAIVLERIPLMLPHEDGAILGAAVRHILMPRLLFPDKATTGSDSEMTNKYTGLGLASEGTSISLGLPAETYIDFGRQLMLLPMLGIGVLCGLIYRSFATAKSPNVILSYGLAVAALIAVPGAGSLLKLMGGLLATFIVLFAFKVTALPMLARQLRRDTPGL